MQAWEAEVPGLDAAPARLTTPLLGLAAALVSRRERVLAGHGLDQPGLETLGALLSARDRASLVRILGHWWQSVESAAAARSPLAAPST